MGLPYSCPLSENNDVDNALESVRVKSISFGDDEVKTPVRTISFGTNDLEPKILKSLGSGKLIVERSVSFQGSDLEKLAIRASSLDKEMDGSVKLGHESGNGSPKMDNGEGVIQKLKMFDPSNPKHEAAIKLQKVYKSFRTRRKLADCAVLVEQSWWKLLDFAELKHSSISFFELEKQETAISRWSRARTRAAKVGKGLSKNDKAQKLALQHWLEAIDPRHRYGHNLHFYYVKWFHSKSREPFFYWLDLGEGKEVNLVEKCPRLKLQQQCIKYLGPMERMIYEVIVEDGKFIYKQTRELLNTAEDAKWIFVLSTSKNLYVGKKKKGTFQHSSFLAGGVTTAAGRLVVERGVLKAVWLHSGHYRPTEDNFKDFISFLRENDVDITDLKTTPVDEEEDLSYKQRSSKHLRMNSYDEELSQTVNDLVMENMNNDASTVDSNTSVAEERPAALVKQKSTPHSNISGELNHREVPKKDVFFETLESEHTANVQSDNNEPANSNQEYGYQSANEEFITGQDSVDLDENLFDKEHRENEVNNVPDEAILRRINSKKETGSYQLGRQLSCKWTTGAGPRIGCVRDYPSELQFRALEQVNLSPRKSASTLSRKASVSASFSKSLTITGSLLPAYGEFLQKKIRIVKAHSLPRNISSCTC